MDSEFELALRLDTADMTKSIPDSVVKVIVELYEYAAESGIYDEQGAAYNNIGSLYYNGRTGAKDYKKAIHYYQKSDACGYRLASENLAFCYYYGFGTEIDYEKAYYYFSKAALAGRYEAMYKIGDMFRYGYYVEVDENMVRVSYMKAEQMMRDAWDTEGATGVRTGSVYLRLGDMYYEGIGLSKDCDRAYECYQRAERGIYSQMRNGDPYSRNDLKKVEERLRELQKILKDELPVLDF